MTTTEDARPIETRGLVLRHAQARWYDLLAAALTLGRDRQLRERLAVLARLAPGEVVLDVGCGTGTLALAAKRVVGATGAVTGVDASPEMIAIASRKAERHGLEVGFRTAVAERLPFADDTFDVVLATLMLHHLPGPVRRECAREALRVLRPGGRVLAVDFARPSSGRGGLLGRLHRHGGVSVDKMVALLRDAGFAIEVTGSVGVSDLQYVLALAPRAGEPIPTNDVIAATRSLPPLPKPRWIVPALAVVAVSAHLWIAGEVAGSMSLSAAGIAAGAVGAIVVAVHLLGMKRRR